MPVAAHVPLTCFVIYMCTQHRAIHYCHTLIKDAVWFIHSHLQATHRVSAFVLSQSCVQGVLVASAV